MTNYVRKGTVDTDGRIILLDALLAGGDTSRSIEQSEKAGQQQLVASAVMPTDLQGGRAEYEALGFVFGEPVAGDEIFTHCTLPEGWSKQASDHDMWSYILDSLGRRRVAVFYKAAFYDRSAFCRIETVGSYLQSALYYKTEPVLDDVWLTVETAGSELEAIATRADKAANSARKYAAEKPDDTYWPGRAIEDDAEAAAARALRDRIAGAR